MRPALLSVLLMSCSLGPPPGISPPAPQGCDPITRGIVGTWTDRSASMEVRADGTILHGTTEGALRWARPGQAWVDFAGSHELHTYGLSVGSQLIDLDDGGHGRVWTRVSALPAYPGSCFEIRGSLVGDWTDGTASESFERDGTYVRGETRGNWSVSDQGFLDLGIGARLRRYRIALAAPDRLVTLLEGPVEDDEPRPVTLVETRLD